MSAEVIKQARAALQSGDFRGAEQIARALTAQTPSAETLELLASTLRAQDRLEDALVAAEQAVAHDPKALRRCIVARSFLVAWAASAKHFRSTTR